MDELTDQANEGWIPNPFAHYRWRWLLFGLACGFLFTVRLYDPTFLGWFPTVANPVKPPELPPGQFVVAPLAQTWDFNSERVPWQPVLALAEISSAVYQDSEPLSITLKKFGLTADASVFPDESMYAVVASNNDTVVVAFRGTNPDEIADWFVNINVVSTVVTNGRVHSGFYRSTKSLLTDIVGAVKTHKGESKKVWITGHSLGGAMALVFAYECLVDGRIKPAGVVTFGQPMLVDSKLAHFLNEKLDGKYLRFVHGGDAVPRMVPTYSHCGNCVWFVGNDYQFQRPLLFAAGKEDDPPPIEYGGEQPKPMTLEEFSRWQDEHKRKRPRFRDRRKIEPSAAPALLEDHYMPGYIHWIVKFMERDTTRVLK